MIHFLPMRPFLIAIALIAIAAFFSPHSQHAWGQSEEFAQRELLELVRKKAGAFVSVKEVQALVSISLRSFETSEEPSTSRLSTAENSKIWIDNGTIAQEYSTANIYPQGSNEVIQLTRSKSVVLGVGTGVGVFDLGFADGITEFADDPESFITLASELDISAGSETRSVNRVDPSKLQRKYNYLLWMFTAIVYNSTRLIDLIDDPDQLKLERETINDQECVRIDVVSGDIEYSFWVPVDGEYPLSLVKYSIRSGSHVTNNRINPGVEITGGGHTGELEVTGFDKGGSSVEVTETYTKTDESGKSSTKRQIRTYEVEFNRVDVPNASEWLDLRDGDKIDNPGEFQIEYEWHDNQIVKHIDLEVIQQIEIVSKAKGADYYLASPTFVSAPVRLATAAIWLGIFVIGGSLFYAQIRHSLSDDCQS